MKSEVSSSKNHFEMTLSLVSLTHQNNKKTTWQYDHGYVVLANHFNTNLIPSFRKNAVE